MSAASYRLVFFEPDPLSGTRLLLGAIVETEEGTFRVRQEEPWWLCALSGKTRVLAIHLHRDMGDERVDMGSLSPSIRIGESWPLDFPNPVSFVEEHIVNTRTPVTMAVQCKPIPDLYQAAADAAGLHKIDVLRGRAVGHVATRWGVWSALHTKGWGVTDIARESSKDYRWDHSTVVSAMARIPEVGERSKELINAAHRATLKALEEKQ